MKKLFYWSIISFPIIAQAENVQQWINDLEKTMESNAPDDFAFYQQLSTQQKGEFVQDIIRAGHFNISETEVLLTLLDKPA